MYLLGLVKDWDGVFVSVFLFKFFMIWWRLGLSIDEKSWDLNELGWI